MARSLGEAAAAGIESGFRLAMDYDANRRQKQRQEQQDSDAQVDRQRRMQREDDAEQLGAVDAQLADARTQEQARVDAGIQATPEQQAILKASTRSLGETRGKILSRRSKIDLPTYQALGTEGVQKLQAGEYDKLAPGQFAAAVTTALGRPVSDALRDGGKPSKVELDAADAIEGLHGQDYPRMYKGLNGLLSKELTRGIGEPSPHGGTILKKEIAEVHPDPRSTQDNPRVVPMLRVYVTGGTPVRGPLPEGAPKGATGYYMAPVTERRSSAPDDPVKSIGLSDFQSYVDNQVKLVELLNSPEGRERVKQDLDSGITDPRSHAEVQASLGVKKGPKATTKITVLPAGSVGIEQSVDAQGNVIRERRLEGREKTSTGRPTLFQEAQDYADENGITVEQALTIMQRGGITKAPKVAGGGGGAGGGASLKERELKRKELKDLNDSDSKDESNARADLVAIDKRLEKAPLSVRKSAETVAERKAATDRLSAIQKRIDERKTKLDKLDDEPASLGSAAKPAARGKGAVLKFDKNGNLVR